MAGGSGRELRVDEIASGVFSIAPWGRTQTVVYALRSADSWVLVDAGWAGDGQRIQRAVETVFGPRSAPSAILLTHVHPDHEGDSRALATDWGCPVYVSPLELHIAARDFSAMRDTAMPLDHWLVLPLMRAMGARRRQAIFDSATLAGVARVLDPSTNIPGPTGLGVRAHARPHGRSRLLLPRGGPGTDQRGRASDSQDRHRRQPSARPQRPLRPPVVHDMELHRRPRIDPSPRRTQTPGVGRGPWHPPERTRHSRSHHRLRSEHRRAHPPLSWTPWGNNSFPKDRSRHRKTLGGKMASVDDFAWRHLPRRHGVCKGCLAWPYG
jgi:hypothetical protein